jgi:phospholipid transport system substrate-binding protein
MRIAHYLLAFSFLWAAASSALAARPLDQVKSTTDRVIAILNDPALQGEAQRSERRGLIHQELEQRFDWNAISRGALGRHWAKLTPEQQKEFMEVFKVFLERVYLDRIEPYYAQLDRITYQGERLVDDKFASVRAVITTTQKVDHPIEYRLHQTTPGDWRVYDVVVEGVSLVRNYRTQFDGIVSRSSYQGLINDLRSRIESNKLEP